jgi:hypothetical protein
MSRTLSPSAKHLLDSARNLSGAADFLSSGKSTFGKWCIPDLLPQQCTAVIYSPTGSGKTFVALHLALSKAAGLPWFGKPMEGGTVVYLVTEDRPGVEARAVAAARHMDLPLDDIAFEFLTPPPIHAEGWASNLIDALREIQGRNKQPIVAVFLDTLGPSFGGRSQDDAAQMTLATDAMQAVAEHFKCAFVTVHHSGKDEARGMRGSQVLKDRVDAVITLSKAKGGAIGINIEKQRNGALGAPLTCRLEQVDIAIGPGRVEHTCIVADLAIASVASPTTAPASGKPLKLSRDERAVLDVIRAAGQPITVRNLGILTKDKLVAIKLRSDNAVRSANSNARKQLLAKRCIEFDAESDTVRICQKTLELQNF